MESNLFLYLAAGLFAFSFQIATAQEMSYEASSALSSIYLVKSDIERGNNLAWQYDYIKSALSKEKRTEYYAKYSFKEHEKKAIDTKLNELAKVAGNYNISLESIEEAQMFAGNPGMQQVFDEIGQVQSQLKNFDPAQSTYYVPGGREVWLWRAVSTKERSAWAKEFFSYSDEHKDVFYKKLDKVAALATTVIPKLKPDAASFAFNNAADEALIKKQLGDLTKKKIHKIGIGKAYENWEILYDESKYPKVPQVRFKRAFVWIKDASDDFPYCRLYQVNLKQDYLGGGKYGPTYAVFLTSWIYGCP